MYQFLFSFVGEGVGAEKGRDAGWNNSLQLLYFLMERWHHARYHVRYRMYRYGFGGKCNLHCVILVQL